MTDDIREKAIEAAARAAMKADGCGLTIEGEHVFCDDPRADREIGREVCLCKNCARAAIDAYERAMWRPEGEAPVDVDYLVRDTGGLIRVAFLRDTGEWCDSASFARIVVRRWRPLPFIVPQPQEDDA